MKRLFLILVSFTIFFILIAIQDVKCQGNKEGQKRPFTELSDAELMQYIETKYELVLTETSGGVQRPGDAQKRFDRELGRLQLAMIELSNRQIQRMACWSLGIAIFALAFSIIFGMITFIKSTKSETTKERVLVDILEEMRRDS